MPAGLRFESRRQNRRSDLTVIDPAPVALHPSEDNSDARHAVITDRPCPVVRIATGRATANRVVLCSVLPVFVFVCFLPFSSGQSFLVASDEPIAPVQGCGHNDGTNKCVR